MSSGEVGRTFAGEPAADADAPFLVSEEALYTNAQNQSFIGYLWPDAGGYRIHSIRGYFIAHPGMSRCVSGKIIV